MSTQEIIQVIGEIVPDNGAALERQHGAQALTVAREMQTALVPRLMENPAYAPLWQQFQAAPQQMAPALAGVLQVLLAADAALARRLDELLAQYRRVAAPVSNTAIHTGGGAYIGGDVTVSGGDFTGRDSVTISGDGNVVGDHSRATVIKQAGADPAAIARAFQTLYQAIEARPNTPPQDKADLQAEVKELEQEVARGDKADENFLARRLRNIGRMAPDLLEVALTTFTNPLAGLGTAARKIAEKMKREAEKSDGGK